MLYVHLCQSFFRVHQDTIEQSMQLCCISMIVECSLQVYKWCNFIRTLRKWIHANKMMLFILQIIIMHNYSEVWRSWAVEKVAAWLFVYSRKVIFFYHCAATLYAKRSLYYHCKLGGPVFLTQLSFPWSAGCGGALINEMLVHLCSHQPCISMYCQQC